MAFKKNAFAMRSAGFKVSPDEMDEVFQYIVSHPSIDPVWVGTTAVGGTTSVQALVLTNAALDYPRNLAYAVAGSNALGGTWTVNGKNQFGSVIQESVVIGTAANGGTKAGSAIFATVTSGTFAFISGSVGNGSPRLGVAIGTGGGSVHKFGLPVKLGGTADIKGIQWINNGTSTTFNGGTFGTAITNGNIDLVNHSFSGTAVVTVTDQLQVNVRSSYVAEENYNNL